MIFRKVPNNVANLPLSTSFVLFNTISRPCVQLLHSPFPLVSMVNSSLIYLALFLLTSLTSATPPLRNNFANTVTCGKSVTPELTYHTSSKINWPLCDPMGALPIGGKLVQCRVLCDNFNHPDITVTHNFTECDYCASTEAKALYFNHKFINSLIDDIVCIPRGTCIQSCGQEKPGCVYSGTCTSQTCFKANGKPVTITRATFAGPGTLIQFVTADGRKVTIGENYRIVPTTVSDNGDVCRPVSGNYTIYARDTLQCGRSGMQAIADGKDPINTNEACRSVCSQYNNRDAEVISSFSTCEYCSSQAADKYKTIHSVKKRICVPRSVCIENCGPELPGCIYSGTCETMHCFSGIDSKKPAVIQVRQDNGSDVEVLIDNQGPALSIDPPIFTSIQPTPSSTPTKKPTPMSTTTPKNPKTSVDVVVQPPGSKTPKPSKEAKKTTSDKEATQSPDDGTSLWIWLGPVLGLVGAGLPAFGYVVGWRMEASVT